MTTPLLCDGKDGAVLTIHLQPKSSHTAWAGKHGNALKIRVAAAPANGEANDALIAFLADEFDVPLRAICIESGVTARRKRLLIRGVSARQLEAHLARYSWWS
ncbi:MAG: DUF167 domain-containing protein [Nitrospira sp.]|nr:DUF167 domain-containing protein [Nitrospira sp.]